MIYYIVCLGDDHVEKSTWSFTPIPLIHELNEDDVKSDPCVGYDRGQVFVSLCFYYLKSFDSLIVKFIIAQL